MAEEKKQWIKGAIRHPGALHKEMGVPEGKKIPAKKLEAAAKKGGKMGKRARLAQTLKGFKKQSVSGPDCEVCGEYFLDCHCPHACPDWDCLLIGQHMPEWDFCTCNPGKRRDEVSNYGFDGDVPRGLWFMVYGEGER